MLVGFVSHVLGSHYSLPPGRNRMDAIGGSKGVEGGLCQPCVPIQHPLGCSEQSMALVSQAWFLMKKLSEANRRGLNLNLAF